MRSKGEPSLSDAEKQGEDDSTATVQDATKVCMFFLIGSKWVTKMNFTFWGATEEGGAVEIQEPRLDLRQGLEGKLVEE